MASYPFPSFAVSINRFNPNHSFLLSNHLHPADPDARKDNKALRKKLFLDQDYDPTRIPLKNGQQKLNITTFIWVLRLASFVSMI